MSVFSWGYGKSGALGTGELKDEHSPVVVEGQLKGKNVKVVSCGEQHSLAVDDLGIVYSWGRNREGQCGTGELSVTVPLPIKITSLMHERVMKVISGSHQSFAITDDGKLYRWGLFHERVLDTTPQFFGIGDMTRISEETKQMIEKSNYLYFANKSETEPGDESVFNDVQSVGALRRKTICIPELVEIEGKSVVDVAAGYCFYLVITDDGCVYSFGFNDKGQLGHNNRFSQDDPKLIEALAGVKIVQAAAGQQHSIVLTADGKVATWGGGVFGLGHGDGEDLLLPKFVEYLKDHNVNQVACGTYHTFLTTDQGLVFSFGHGEYGQQGTGDSGQHGEQSRNALFPKQMTRLPFQSPVKSIYCGHLHTIFILEDGTIWTCGWGTCGVLGHGDQKYRLTPTHVKSLEGDMIVYSSGGWKHTLAIKEGSTTFALDYEKMVASEKRSDLIFLVDRKPIYAHQAIVCSRSPKIRSMVAFHTRFSKKKLEKVTLEIKGPRYVTFKAMLNYLYTDHLSINSYFAKEVAELAHKFQIPRLQSMCHQLIGKARNQKVHVPISSYPVDLIEMVDSPHYSDIIFEFSKPKETVYGHKIILIIRCPYFNSLFESKHFADSDVSAVNMDMCPVGLDIFKLTLQFIYTGNREIVTPEVAMDLLIAADFFLMEDLKRVCEDVVENNLEGDVELVDQVMKSSEVLGAKRLYHYCKRLLKDFQEI